MSTLLCKYKHDIKGMGELLNAVSGEVEMQVTGQDGSDEQ